MFNQRKHKDFNYRPRFQDSEAKKATEDFKSKWEDIKPTSKRKGSICTSFPVLVIMLIAIFVLIYILNGYIK